jgi:hypothetical protein
MSITKNNKTKSRIPKIDNITNSIMTCVHYKNKTVHCKWITMYSQIK